MGVLPNGLSRVVVGPVIEQEGRVWGRSVADSTIEGWHFQPWAWEPECPDSGQGGLVPDVGWKWGKWTFGFWTDPKNKTWFGIDVGPLEIVWRMEGYRP